NKGESLTQRWLIFGNSLASLTGRLFALAEGPQHCFRVCTDDAIRASAVVVSRSQPLLVTTEINSRLSELSFIDVRVVPQCDGVRLERLDAFPANGRRFGAVYGGEAAPPPQPASDARVASVMRPVFMSVRRDAPA